jgi:hypothetical protein
VLSVASVNQKPIRAIPVESKGFEIAFPRDRSFSGAGDISVAKLAQTEDRVLVTSDSDFSRLNFKPGDVPQIGSRNRLTLPPKMACPPPLLREGVVPFFRPYPLSRQSACGVVFYGEK